MMGRRRVSRRRDGTYALRLPDEERAVLRHLLPQLRAPLEGSTPAGTDDALRRLFPTAHPADERLDAEYRSLVHDDLVRARLEALDVVAATVDDSVLDDGQLSSWIGVLNDWRLVLGTRLDVSEDDEPDERLQGDDPESYALYHYLSWLMGEMVDAQLASLPD